MIIKSQISTKTNKPYVAIFDGDKIHSFDSKTINSLIDMYAYNEGLHPKAVFTKVYNGEIVLEINIIRKE